MVIGAEDKHYLYVVADDGADASVLEYTHFDDGVKVSEKVIPFGFVEFRGAQNPIRIDDRGCSVVTQAAVTPVEPVIPVFRGVFKIANDFFATLWGYTSNNTFIIDQPRQEVGLTRNHIIGGTPEQQALLPQLFASGDVQEAFVLYTFGEEIKWELETQAGGGVATTDYTLELSEEAINTFAGYIVRQVSPGFLRYNAADPLTVRQVSEELLGRVTLNQAGLGFDNTTVVRHTREVNDDIPGQSAWYGRSLACRMEGGALQAHGEAGRASRILAPQLAPELARGSLFTVPPLNLSLYPIIKLTDAIAQEDERMGLYMGVSDDGSIVALSADQFTDGSFTNLGRVIVWKKDSGTGNTATNIALLEPPPDWTRADDMDFGRFTEVSPAGDFIFITGKKGPGVAIFTISETGVVTYLKTLTWAGYTARPDGEKGIEGSFSDDGQTFIVSTGAASLGGATVPAEVFILQTTDNWDTFTVVQTITKPGGGGANVFNRIDSSNDASVLSVANWQLNQVYVFRTTDNWTSFTTYTFTNPAEYTFGVDDGSSMGLSMAVSSDGFRVFAGAPDGDIDYGAGVVANAGSVEEYLYNVVTDTYDRLGRVTPSETLPANAFFGRAIRFNHPSSRIGIIATGVGFHRLYVYGIHTTEIDVINTLNNVFVEVSEYLRWFADADTLVVTNIVENGVAENDIGAYRYLDYRESP